GGDNVNADAQDGSGTNNANFLTTPDGNPSSRMQMFIWIDAGPTINARLTVNTGPAAGDYEAAQGSWGGTLDPPTTADMEIVDDGSGNPSLGCGPLIGFTPGNIALIDRGTCEFGTKALNAENAGASGAIIMNDLQQGPNGVITMGAGADGGSVTIPAIMIGNADGLTIRTNLPANGTMQCPVGGCPLPNPINRDSDLDNGVIAHEYGHGISNRLTGGPANVGCLQHDEQAGEGWSDWWTVALTPDPADTATTPRAVGNYVTFQDPVTGIGIRNFPYTTDMGVNPFTYEDIDGVSIPHGVGSVWNTMLWEMYWNLVHRYGFDEDLYTGTGGNNVAIQLVIDGMKLQPCTPTFVDARDAILAADVANNAGANECEIWNAFAKRGLGFSADAGGTGVGDETEAFDLPPGVPSVCTAIFSDGFESGDTSAWSNTVP
ncbi:MAG: M36 family metallopeptidase, partial [Acidobacteriota bacterium]|nr:M36 family metallopeptidase [Acidobacteriota bacterium]